MNTHAEHAESTAGTRHPMLPLVLDVAVPLGAYYLMQHLGFSLMVSLVVSGLVPAIRVIASAVRERRVEGLALAVLTLTVISIPVAFIAGSPKVMLAKDAIGTGALGVWLIVSALISRPAMADSARPFLAKTASTSAAWDQLVVDSPNFRAALNAMTTVWGIGFLVECVARIAMVVVLPVQTAVWALNIPLFVVIVACVVIQRIWGRKLYLLITERVAENEQHTAELPVLRAA
jgi:hypothetical protein